MHARLTSLFREFRMLHKFQSSVPMSRAAGRRRGIWHGVACFAGLLALMLHLFSPNIARASSGEWIEICSGSGPVMMQVDLSGEGSTPDLPCPKCKHCTLCMVSVTTPPVFETITLTLGSQMLTLTQSTARIELPQRRYQRPMSRAPPAPDRDIFNRATRTSLVSSNTIGGASWT